MRQFFLLLLFCFVSIASTAQTKLKFNERLLFKMDTFSSNEIKTYGYFVTFNNEPCVIYHDRGKNLLFTKTKVVTLGEKDFVSDGYTYTLNDSTCWYHNLYLQKIYSPSIGKIPSRTKSYQYGKSFIYTTLWKDTIYIWKDNELINKTYRYGHNYRHPEEVYDALETYTAYYKWAKTSIDGSHYMYILDKCSMHYLYKDDILVDSSADGFEDLAILPNGNYSYVHATYGYGDTFNLVTKTPNNTYSSHSRGFQFKIFGTDSNYYYVAKYLMNKSKFYINDKEYEFHFSEKNKVHTPVVQAHFAGLNQILVFTNNQEVKILINHQALKHKYSKVYFPRVDEAGNYAFIGYKNYYLYLHHNGKKTKLTKYGVRPTPLYLDAQGNTIMLYKTGDSAYLYKNNTLVGKTMSIKNGFLDIDLKDPDELSSQYIIRSYVDYNFAYYLGDKDQAFYITNDKISLVPPINNPEHPESTVIRFYYDYYFGSYYIRKFKDNSYQFVINGKVYETITNIKEINLFSLQLTNSGFRFTALKEDTYYEYTTNF